MAKHNGLENASAEVLVEELIHSSIPFPGRKRVLHLTTDFRQVPKIQDAKTVANNEKQKATSKAGRSVASLLSDDST